MVRVWIWKFPAIFSCPSVCFHLVRCLCTFLPVYVSVHVVFELLSWMSRDSGDFINLLENLSFTLGKMSPPSWGGLCRSVLVAVLGLLLWAWLCWNQNLTQPLSITYMVSVWFLFVLCCKFTTMCPAFLTRDICFMIFFFHFLHALFINPIQRSGNNLLIQTWDTQLF